MSVQKNVLVTFGSDFRWQFGSRRLASQMAEFAEDTVVVRIEPKDLTGIGATESDMRFMHENALGFGFWLWKPLIVNWALKTFPQDSVLYLDSGCEINSTPEAKRTFLCWSERVWQGESIFWEVEGDRLEREYSKIEVTRTFHLTENDLNSKQIQATAMWINSNELGRHIAEEWLNTSRDFNLLDEKLREAQDPDFIAPRHDQSILSCVLKSLGVDPSINKTHFAPDWVGEGGEYPFWTLRNRGLLSRKKVTFSNKAEDLVRKLF
jgi:hypothetical protein